MRIHWKRKFRRRKKLPIYLALLSVINMVFPQHVAAQAPAPAFRQQLTHHMSDLSQEQGVAQRTTPTLPAIPQVPAKRATNVVATAYTSSIDETDGDPFTTASGARVADGVIAANGFAFGTRVRLTELYGDKVFIVLDRMHPRYEKHRIDVWMPSKQQAKQFGAKYLKMEIL